MISRGAPVVRRRPGRPVLARRCHLVPAVRRPRPRPASPPRIVRTGHRISRVPAGGVTLPVRGCSFREGQWPDNLYRLNEVLRIGEGLTEYQWQQWALNKLKRGPFKNAVVRVMEIGELPIRLEREPDNPVDPYAVTVWAPYLGDKGFLGYLPARGGHGRILEAIAHGLDDAGPNAFRCWVHKVRIHPDHLDYPGIDVTVQPRRRR